MSASVIVRPRVGQLGNLRGIRHAWVRHQQSTPFVFGMTLGRDYFLPNASLTFSPACFRFAVVCSPLPCVSRDWSPVALPSSSFALPLASSSLLFALSPALILSLLLRCPPCSSHSAH